MNASQPLGPGVMLSSVLLITASACSGVQPVESLVVLNQRDCENLAAGVHETSLAAVSKLRRNRLLPAPDAAPLAAQAELPELTSTRLFAISKGPQPTPGYSFAVDSLQLTGDELRLQLNWQSPAADAVMPQMITQPCIVVGIPDTNARNLVVLDQSGEFARLKLPPNRAEP